MLSSTSRTLTYLSALSYLLLGVVLFIAPGWGSGKFAWNVSPFVLMTMGGWCLGNAVFAWQSARIWRWALVYPSLIYLWMFGIFESVVLVMFRERVTLGTFLASGYMLTIAINLLAAIVGIIDVIRLRPSARAEGVAVPFYVRALIIIFTINLGVLGLGGFSATAGGLSTEGGIFPEPLTPFTVRAFAAFFSAIFLSAFVLIWARNLTPMFAYGTAGLILIVPIVIAALVNLGTFDFSGRPGGILYLGAYLFTFVVSAWGLWHYREARKETEIMIG